MALNANPAGTRDFSLHLNVQKVSGTHPASYTQSTDVLSRGWRGRNPKLISHLHLDLMLRISGVLSLLLLFVFKALTRTVGPLPFTLLKKISFRWRTSCIQVILKMKQCTSSCKVPITFDRFWTNLHYTDKL